jgi:hypothetical protein
MMRAFSKKKRQLTLKDHAILKQFTYAITVSMIRGADVKLSNCEFRSNKYAYAQYLSAALKNRIKKHFKRLK